MTAKSKVKPVIKPAFIVELSDELPPTLNDQIAAARSGWRVSAGMKKQWTNQIALTSHGLRKFELGDKVWFEIHFFIKTFARDPDNINAALKFVFDGLVDAEILPNDNLTIIQSPTVHYYHRAKSDYFVLRLSNTPEFLMENFILQE